MVVSWWIVAFLPSATIPIRLHVYGKFCCAMTVISIVNDLIRVHNYLRQKYGYTFSTDTSFTSDLISVFLS